jgi:hypothetical protein
MGSCALRIQINQVEKAGIGKNKTPQQRSQLTTLIGAAAHG